MRTAGSQLKGGGLQEGVVFVSRSAGTSCVVPLVLQSVEQTVAGPSREVAHAFL